jgi:hypothetical protein
MLRRAARRKPAGNFKSTDSSQLPAGLRHAARQGRRKMMKGPIMIRKLKSGQYRLYSRKANPRTGKRRNLGTFATREEALQHERAVQFFKHRHG